MFCQDANEVLLKYGAAKLRTSGPANGSKGEL